MLFSLMGATPYQIKFLQADPALLHPAYFVGAEKEGTGGLVGH